MKKILGLDLGTNSIGWALIEYDFNRRAGNIQGMGSRIIPMAQDVLGIFDAGQSYSQTAQRTTYRGVRRLYQRDNLRRERLHRVLNVLDFLPKHYAEEIDFEKYFGQFKENKEPKIAYRKEKIGKFEFIFKESFEEMIVDFREMQPKLFYLKKNGEETKIPYDWTIYYLRKKALSQKITKAELAWILLNFNQKRGYYQLRGEEEEIEKNKDKSFEILKVDRIEDSGDKIKGKDIPLYDVYFTNGWKYDKQIVKTEDWIGKTKEFIVTTKTLASGEVKRTYKAVNSEEDWVAIKQKTEQNIETSGKTVGEYIYDTLLQKPNQKVRGKLIRTIERKFYKDELVKIIEKQKEFHIELQDEKLYKLCVEELYRNNEAHRANIANKDFTYLFVEDIIFYQRPLKSQKSLISRCTLECREYENNGLKEKQGVRCIPKSSPLYQEFRLLQWLKNLRIYKKEDKQDVDVTSVLLPSISELEELLVWLNDKTEIDQNTFLKYPKFKLEDKILEDIGREAFLIYKKSKEKDVNTYYRWNFVEDKKYPLNETRGELLKRLKKAKIDEKFLTVKAETDLWHILYSVEDKNEIESALIKYAKRYDLPDSFVETFKKYPRIDKEYGAFSAKAIKRLLPLMRFGKCWNYNEIDNETQKRIEKIITGECDEKIKDKVREKAINLKQEEDFQNLPFWLASYVVYNRYSEVSEIKHWNIPADIELLRQHSLRNPIVEQVINETLQTVKDIWLHYGNGTEKFFDEIHVELGREMKNSAEKRKLINDRVIENQNTNIRIKALLSEMFNDGDVENVRPHSPSQQELLKIYEEGVYYNEQDEKCLYEINKIRKKNQPTASDIKRYKLWLQQGYKSPYTGEMIPLSKLFTSAYEIEHIIPQSRFFDDSLSNKVISESEVNKIKDNQLAYEFIKNNEGRKIELGYGKVVEILSVDAYEENVKRYFSDKRLKTKREKLLLEDIPDSFINRQMNDTRYISKVIKSLLSNIVRGENEEEGTAKNLIVVSGGVTTRLKNDWGLNDVWNGLITPRFERLNQMVGEAKYGAWENKEGKQVFQINTIEPELLKLNKKRIDHRHHAIDALVVACSSRDHVNYLNNQSAAKDKKTERFDLRNKLRNIESYIDKDGRQRQTAKEFIKPWETFTQDAKNRLYHTVVSFKNNNRVINKTVNKYQKWQKQLDGSMKKVFVKQQKGDNWAIRKPLHKETVYGFYNIETPKGKIATSVRTSLTEIKNEKHLAKVTDARIREVILPNHLKNYIDDKGKPQYELAFSLEGIEELNKNIIQLNNGIKHHPIYKVKLYEIGTRFPLSDKKDSPKSSKYVEAAKGTNLFFAIYVDEEGKRSYETIPLNVAIERQKQGLSSCPEKDEKGNFLLFDLSPNDLVYVPTLEEQENPTLVDVQNLSQEQVKRIYKMVSTTQNKLECVPFYYSSPVITNEMGANNKNQNTIDGMQIKSVCWKLKVDRLGNIIDVIK